MNSIFADKTKICPQCGNSFACSPADCWCSKLPAIMPMNIEGECYCPRCLEAIIGRKTKGERQG